MTSLGYIRPICSPFSSAREACRHVLHNSRTDNGAYLPLTPAEVTPRLHEVGFFVSERDTEALLRELAADGELVEIDALAGYRWCQRAA